MCAPYTASPHKATIPTERFCKVYLFPAKHRTPCVISHWVGGIVGEGCVCVCGGGAQQCWALHRFGVQ